MWGKDTVNTLTQVETGIYRLIYGTETQTHFKWLGEMKISWRNYITVKNNGNINKN